MRVSRTGLTPIKGGRHLELPFVDLTAEGPVGDRVLCLVDPARDRVLRTVENPSLLRTSAHWRGEVLEVSLPGRTVAGVPVPTGEQVKAEYWGRTVALDLLDGPWSRAYSEHLGHEVRLARAGRPGDVVYGASVTLVATASLADLSRRAGGTVDPAQLRATFVVESPTPYAEDGWVGRHVRLGDAVVEVRGPVPRCAVTDLDPDTGERRVPVLRTLAGYRRLPEQPTVVVFGVEAVVSRPGRVRPGDPVDVLGVVERG